MSCRPQWGAVSGPHQQANQATAADNLTCFPWNLDFVALDIASLALWAISHYFDVFISHACPDSLNGRPPLTSPNRNILHRNTFSSASCRLAAMGAMFYAVAVGHKPGIYGSWAYVVMSSLRVNGALTANNSEAHPQVSRYSGCLHKSFKTRSEAEEFIQLNQLAQAEVGSLLADTLGALQLTPGVERERPVDSMRSTTEVQSVDPTPAEPNETQGEARRERSARGGRPRGWQKPAQNVDISVALRVRDQPRSRRGGRYTSNVTEAIQT